MNISKWTRGLWLGVVLSAGPVSSPAAFQPSLEITSGGEFFTENDFTGSGTLADPVMVTGSMQGESGYLEFFNLNRYGNFALTTHDDAIWLHLEVFNGTPEVWDNFDFELQTSSGEPSTDPDGLSFAQGYEEEQRPWTSENYGAFEEFNQDRDFINFTAGTVSPGQTAVFNFIVSHNGQANPVQLLLRPNYSPILPPIPEPSVMAFAGLALVGWFGTRRWRRS